MNDGLTSSRRRCILRGLGAERVVTAVGACNLVAWCGGGGLRFGNSLLPRQLARRCLRLLQRRLRLRSQGPQLLQFSHRPLLQQHPRNLQVVYLRQQSSALAQRAEVSLADELHLRLRIHESGGRLNSRPAYGRRCGAAAGRDVPRQFRRLDASGHAKGDLLERHLQALSTTCRLGLVGLERRSHLSEDAVPLQRLPGQAAQLRPQRLRS
mmetsp:Transcript_2662/g.7639  ORF Transcript_2662/g.7639 Transcript_2662/m.7639 type:complete len:210 (-) Transcript_2662:147-776(-)